MLKDKLRTKQETDEYMSELKRWLESVREDEAEEMVDFFAKRIDIYDSVHTEHWGEIYDNISDYFKDGLVNLLDIGCGTGLELKSVFARFPNAEVTGIDISEQMLNRMKDKYPMYKIRSIQADYFEYPFEDKNYDAAMSFETLHHFKYEKKSGIYRKIYQSLKNEGYYVECDYIACCEEEERICKEVYDYKMGKGDLPADEFAHIDIPLTLEHELELIKNAGFERVKVLYRNCSTIIIRAEK